MPNVSIGGAEGGEAREGVEASNSLPDHNVEKYTKKAVVDTGGGGVGGEEEEEEELTAEDLEERLARSKR